MRDSGKRKISLRETGFDYYPGSRIHQNLGTGWGIVLPVFREFEDLTATREAGSGIHQNLETGYGIFFACLSGIREVVGSSGKCESNRREFGGVSYPILSPSSFFFSVFPSA